MTAAYTCPICKQEKPKVQNRTPCADCYRVAHRAASLESWRKKRDATPPASSGKGWDSTKANELLMRKL